MHSTWMKSGDEGNMLGCGDIHHTRVLAGLSLRRTLPGGEMDQVIKWNHNVSISSLNHHFMSNEDGTSDKSHLRSLGRNGTETHKRKAVARKEFLKRPQALFNPLIKTTSLRFSVSPTPA
jgi:hypothetical protein